MIRRVAWRLLIVALPIGAALALGGCAVAFNVAIGNTTSGPSPLDAGKLDPRTLSLCKP
jgi:hypothetical protein